MKITFPLFAVLSIALAGCNPTSSSGPKGGVALMDLDAVAKRVGRDVAIIQELKDAGGPLSDQLTAAQKESQADFEKFKDSLGAKPTEADNQKLAEHGRALNLQLQQKQQQAQQELNAKRAALVNRFREEIKPVALKIAAAKGLGLVLLKSDLVVLGNDPALDITDEVVAELMKAGGKSATPAPSATP